MSLVDADLSVFPPLHMSYSRSVTATFDAITTNSDQEQLVFQIPKTGTIDKIHYRIATVSSPVMTHRIELRTVDAATGLANAAGTLYGGSTSIGVSAATYAAATNYTAAIAASVTAGDIAAIVFDLSAFTSGSFTQQIQVSELIGQTNTGKSTAFPYRVSGNSPGAPAKNTAGFAIQCTALEYSGGIFVPILGINNWAGFNGVTTCASNSTVRCGNTFTPRSTRRAIGMYAEAQGSGAYVYRLRLASDDSILATATVDKDITAATTSRAPAYHLFDSGASVVVEAGVAYYLSLEATDTVGNDLFGLFLGVSQAMLDICPGGQNCYGFTYAAGSYTFYTSADAVRRYGIGLITDQEDDGTGAGRASLSIGV